MHSDKVRIVARPGGWRLRWAAIAVAAPLFGMVAAFGTVQDVPEPVFARTVVQSLALPVQPSRSGAALYFQEDRIQRSDTPAALFERFGAAENDAETLGRSLRSFRLPRPGTAIQASVSEEGKVQALRFLSDRDMLVSIDRFGDALAVSERRADFARGIEMRSGEIQSSLFAATDAAGIADNVAIQIADIFSGEIDFHRDLRRGDRFAVVFETVYFNGRALKSERVLAAEFINRGKTYRAVWFQDAGGKSGYFTPEGKNLRKAFLRSPLEFSRVTSRFGMRHHPILGQWRAHNGVDYAAPIGTRVKATGDGLVEFAGQRSSYGNLIVLRHHGGYSTYYAHLKGFARGLRAGVRVAQGDMIGYVGRTGWATGPHLHYEFLAHNRNRNPLTMAFPAAEPVSEQQLAAFREASARLATHLDLLKNGNLALLE